MSEELLRLNAIRQRLADTLLEVDNSLAEVDRQIAALRPPQPPRPADDYRIALRPDDRTADPLGNGVLMDDIVVRDVEMFRAEQMDDDTWWVCCYLAGEDTTNRLAWSVRARCRPKRLDWITTEFPEGVAYEHERGWA